MNLAYDTPKQGIRPPRNKPRKNQALGAWRHRFSRENPRKITRDALCSAAPDSNRRQRSHGCQDGPGGGGGGPTIAILEDAGSSSTRNANRINLGEPGRGGDSAAGAAGEDGEGPGYVKLDADGGVATTQSE